MNVYIWTSTDPVSGNWHSGGGLLVVAADLRAARKLARTEIPAMGVKVDALLSAEWLTSKPDYVLKVDGATKPRVIVFPNAGCC